MLYLFPIAVSLCTCRRSNEKFFESLRLPLAKGSSTSNQAFLLRRKDVTALLGAWNRYALRLADHQRSAPGFTGWDCILLFFLFIFFYCSISPNHVIILLWPLIIRFTSYSTKNQMTFIFLFKIKSDPQIMR